MCLVHTYQYTFDQQSYGKYAQCRYSKTFEPKKQRYFLAWASIIEMDEIYKIQCNVYLMAGIWFLEWTSAIVEIPSKMIVLGSAKPATCV